jgi:hypothetical protein
MAVIMKNAIFWDDSTWLLLELTFLHSVRQLLVTANVLSSLILSILMMEAIRSSKTKVLTRATRRHIPEEGILFQK